MTLTQLAKLYYSEGCRGEPVGSRQSKKLFLRDLNVGNGKFKSIKSLLKRMGWHENRKLTQPQLQVIYARLGNF